MTNRPVDRHMYWQQPIKDSNSLADLAAFIVEQLTTDTYVNQTVTIANR